MHGFAIRSGGQINYADYCDNGMVCAWPPVISPGQQWGTIRTDPSRSGVEIPGFFYHPQQFAGGYQPHLYF